MAVPEQPSPQAVRALHKARAGGQRRTLTRLEPRGARLAAFRTMLHAIDVLSRPRHSRRIRLGGRAVDLVAAGRADAARGVLLHLHGGAFVLPPAHRAGASALAERTGLPIVLPRYRRAPEHPFPAAADDVLAAYRELSDRGAPIVLTGDSADGSLALALLGDLRRAGLPMPTAVWLLSPLVDPTAACAKRCDEAQPDPVTPPRLIEITGKAYLGDTSPTDPRLDVLGAGMRGWPPMLIQVGDTECITGENQTLAERVTAAGGVCELQSWPAQTHVFQFNGLRGIPEASAALDYGAAFVT